MPPAPPDSGLWREIIGALLILGGIVGGVVVGFAVNDHLGWALVCGVAIATGTAVSFGSVV